MRADNGALCMKNGIPTRWHDLIRGVQIPFDSSRDIAYNQVLIRANGMPVYHFASVVDDIDMGVNLVIRGMDHALNTFRHTAFYSALNADPPDFAHIGLITHGGRKSPSAMMRPVCCLTGLWVLIRMQC